jgi:hypothetical protein
MFRLSGMKLPSKRIPVPESHLKLAEARLRRYREDPSSQPAFDVLDRLAKDRK